MKYLGSKNKIAQSLLSVMLLRRDPDQFWIEPFVGGGNMIDKVPGNRIGGDSNRFAIEGLISIRDHVHELPRNNSEFTEKDYYYLPYSDFPHKGFAGFAYSFKGKWMGGWSRGANRDYVYESYHNAVAQSNLLQGVELVVSSYEYLKIPENSFIYCDPPYKNTTKYIHTFDHPRFWDWCRLQVENGHTVYVSEYEAPKDFKCVWSQKLEKLWLLEPKQ